MKKQVGPLRDAQRVILCCGCCGQNGDEERGESRRRGNRFGLCLNFNHGSLDKISDISKASNVDFVTRGHKSPLAEKVADAVCLIQHSPFRILRVSDECRNLLANRIHFKDYIELFGSNNFRILG